MRISAVEANREETIYTAGGIDSLAGDYLWEMVKHDKKNRNRVLSVINEYHTYYKSLSKVNPRIRKHLFRLIMQEGDDIVESKKYPYSTFLRNVLKSIYKKNMRKADEEQRAAKLPPSR
jgi:hypothetical protein